MMDAAAQQMIERGLRSGGFVRRHPALSGHAKEWLHFCIATPDLFVLLNFSVSERHMQGEQARLTCVVFDGAWHGDVETFESDEVQMRAGRLDLAFGESSVRLCDDGLIELRAALPRRALRIELTLRPDSFPLLVNNVSAGNGELIHWFVMPRLAANGTVRCGARVRQLDGVPAYHDHNWGTFGWGGDFAWIWGFAHPCGEPSPWSLTFDRFMNRARNVDRARALMIWRDGRQHRLFRDRDVEIEAQGFLRPREVLRVPRPMALCAPSTVLDLPQRLFVRARGRNDAIDVEVTCDDACQVLVPDDHGTGVTLITEARCQVVMSGRIRGERVEAEASGVFELIGSET